MYKYVHICPLDKFIPPFIEFIKRNFNFEEHAFLLYGDNQRFPYSEYPSTVYMGPGINFKIIFEACSGKPKIFLHSFPYITKLPFIFIIKPWLLKRTYWLIWGYDLYSEQYSPKYSELGYRSKAKLFLRTAVLRYFYGIICDSKGDFELACQLYKTRAEHFGCFIYTSNIFHSQGLAASRNSDGPVTILVGNSGDPSNNHREIFVKLADIDDGSMKVICPLSYGDSNYIERVCIEGKAIFGDRFIPLLTFMKLDEYSQLLSTVDIAVFAHNRQQAVGNIVNLLGYGKKVYLSSKVTTREYFTQMGITLFAFENGISLEPFSETLSKANTQIIRSYFNESNLAAQWDSVFKA